MPVQIPIDYQQLNAFCERWKVAELAFFGSVLRDDFGPESDVDVLVRFNPEAEWGLLQHAQMGEELAEVLGRPVDLVSRRAVESSSNWIRKREILNSAEVVHAAG